MRTSAICIRGYKNKKKRKLNEDDDDTKENINCPNIKKSKNNTSVTVEAPKDNMNRFTQWLISPICNSLKRSVKKIGLHSLDIFSSTPAVNWSRKILRPKAFIGLNSPLNTSRQEVGAPSHPLSPRTNPSPSLPLTDHLCIIQGDFEWNTDLEPPNCKIDLRNLQSYLECQKNILRRSISSILPTHTVCSSADVIQFMKFIEADPMISLFLKRDICRRYADKYLLAMVFVYFVRAGLSPFNFRRESFFAALYLAHDMEEDIDEMKYEVFPFCFGSQWKKYYSYLLAVRDDLFWAMNCRAIVSKKCCEQMMHLISDHWMWQRERPEYHGHVFEERTMIEDFDHPKGPFNSPLWCRECLERECEESENSYIVYSSPSEVSSVTSQESKGSPDISMYPLKDSGYESFIRMTE